MGRWRSVYVVAMLLAIPPRIVAAVDEARPPIGRRIADLEFKDIRYLSRTLDDFGKKKVFVVVATNTTCPVAQRYLPVVAKMEAGYRDRGVQFLALNVGAGDSIIEMAAQAVEAGVEFPFVKDAGLR